MTTAPSRAATVLAALASIGLGLGQEALLFELDRTAGASQAQLAAAAHCEPPTVTMAVRKLEAAGLVARAPSPHDARALVVTLTDAGRALMPRLREVWRQVAEESSAALTEAERAAFLRMAGAVAGTAAHCSGQAAS